MTGSEFVMDLSSDEAVNQLRSTIPGCLTEEFVADGTEWRNSILGLLNCVLSACRPGLRLCLICGEDGDVPAQFKLSQLRCEDEEHDLPKALRQIADQLD